MTGTLLMNRQSGSTVPASVTTTGQQATIIFESDSSIESTGFSAQITASAASSISTAAPLPAACEPSTSLLDQSVGASGTITSGTNDVYEAARTCEWAITASDAAASEISLEFSAFRLEVNFDFVYVFDKLSPSESDSAICTSTGLNVPDKCTSTSGAMTVRFISDYAVVDSGFVATWNIQQKQGTPVTVAIPEFGCNDAIPSDVSQGAIIIGNSATGQYAISETCSWSLSGPRITLQFEYFETEFNYDLIKVYDSANLLRIPSFEDREQGKLQGQQTASGTLSADDLATVLTSTSGSMLVEWTSDSSVVERGFKAVFTIAN